MTSWLKADFDANTNASTLEVDFYRVWQDDAPTTGASNVAEPATASSEPDSIESLASSFGGTVISSDTKEQNNNVLSATTVSPTVAAKATNSSANWQWVTMATVIFVLLPVLGARSYKARLRTRDQLQYLTAQIEALNEIKLKN